MRYRHAHVELDPPSLGPWLDGWKDAGPHAGALALLPESQARHVPFLQAAFRERGLALVGAIFPALVTDEGFSTTGAWLLGFDAMPPAFLLEGLGRDGRADAAKLAEAARTHCLRSPGEPAPTLFLVFDAMIPDIASTLLGVFGEIRDTVRYAGVNAGSETFRPLPCLFDGERVVSDGVLGLSLEETPVVVKHGYPVAKTLMRATSTTGNRIRLIDGRRAMDVYREVIRADFGVDLTHGNFYDYAVHFPFGVISAADVVVRIPVAFEDDGSIACVGEVPPESMLRLLRAPSLDESPCVDAIAGALPAAPGRGPLLAFYCAGRRMHLGGDAATELSRLRQATGASALVGALSLGEIGIFEGTGIPQFHNAALVCA
ncbi:MAG TPA: FIST C-terminal domain-containing protein [Usitatibacteraceae bacterium]|nr:FIST C-terminal domain-containing protein [Usitatibacteraceae bacterium]